MAEARVVVVKATAVKVEKSILMFVDLEYSFAEKGCVFASEVDFGE